MEQVTVLLKNYLDYLPPELKEEQFITASTINNYVRTKVMPEPLKKRYYRLHIAYLIVILTLKYNLSIALIQKLIPVNLSEEEMRNFYTSYVERHRIAASFFVECIRSAAGPILDHEEVSDNSVTTPEELITSAAVISGFTRLFVEKLLLLEGKDLETGGSIEIETPVKKR